MRYGRTLLAGLGWAATIGGLALCVLIFLSVYLAFDDHGTGVAPRKDEIIRLPSVPEAEVPRVPLGRPPARIGGGRGGGTLAPRGTPPSTTPVPAPRAPAGAIAADARGHDPRRAQGAGAAGPVITRRSQRSEWPCSSASC